MFLSQVTAARANQIPVIQWSYSKEQKQAPTVYHVTDKVEVRHERRTRKRQR